MKLVAIGSDLHLDTKAMDCLKDTIKPETDMVFLLGDVGNFEDKDILYSIAELTTVPILFVPGNHDYWGGSIDEVNTWLIELSNEYPNFIPMLGDRIEFIGDIPVMGHPLWYPDTTESWILQNSMKDFKFIKEAKPWVFHQLNGEGREYFKSGPSNAIWLMHHLPSLRSISERYKRDRLNCYFVDPGMERIILEKEPRLVIHGHSHRSVIYRLGESLVMSNPRGHKSENPHWDWQYLLLG